MPLRSASSCSHEKQMFSYRVVVYLHVCDPKGIPRYIGGLVFGKHFLLYRSAQPCSATLQISAVIARPSIIPIQESHLGAELGRTSMAMCLGDFFGRIHLDRTQGLGPPEISIGLIWGHPQHQRCSSVNRFQTRERAAMMPHRLLDLVQLQLHGQHREVCGSRSFR